jgi:hypothetical protein
LSLAWWLPIVALEYFLCGWLTFKNSNGAAPVWFWLSWGASVIPIWPLISKYSKDLVRDGLIFDVTMTLVYTTSILYFTKSFSKFGANQYLGLLCVMGGMYLFKRGT